MEPPGSKSELASGHGCAISFWVIEVQRWDSNSGPESKLAATQYWLVCLFFLPALLSFFLSSPPSFHLLVSLHKHLLGTSCVPGDKVVMTLNLAPSSRDFTQSATSRDLTHPFAAPCMPRATLCTAPEGFTSEDRTTLWEARVNRSLCKAGTLTTALFARTPCPRSCQLAQEQRRFSKQRWLLTPYLLASYITCQSRCGNFPSPDARQRWASMPTAGWGL